MNEDKIRRDEALDTEKVEDLVAGPAPVFGEVVNDGLGGITVAMRVWLGIERGAMFEAT